MSLADVCYAMIIVILVPYAVLAGADFGAGMLDLLAGRGKRADRQRSALNWAMGPVWEANHVWLIFALVATWCLFPPAFDAVSIALYFPMGFALLGIVLRGSAFAFRGHYDGTGAWTSVFTHVFQGASLLAPFMFGCALAALATEGIAFEPNGALASPGVIEIWTGPFQLLSGLLAVAVCGYLGATFIAADMNRIGERDLADTFRSRAFVLGAVAGVLSIVALVVTSSEAPRVFDNLMGKALPVAIGAVIAGGLSLGAIAARRYGWARGLLALAVTGVIASFGWALYPQIVGASVTVANAASPENIQSAFLIILGIGLALFAIPAMYILYVVFRREPPPLPE